MSRWTAEDIPPQRGRTAVVTGAAGLGFETARALARAGAQVIVASRNPETGAEAIGRIKRETPSALVRFEAVDLGDLGSVAALATRLRDQIQGLDLLGRKVLMNNGAAFRLLAERMQRDIEAADDPALAELAQALRTARATAIEVTRQLGQTAARGEVDLFLANAAAYLEMLGHTVVAWLWLQQAQRAQAALAGAGAGAAAGADDALFYEGKLRAARYFFRYELPRAAHQAELLLRLDDTCLTMPVAAF